LLQAVLYLIRTLHFAFYLSDEARNLHVGELQPCRQFPSGPLDLCGGRAMIFQLREMVEQREEVHNVGDMHRDRRIEFDGVLPFGREGCHRRLIHLAERHTAKFHRRRQTPAIKRVGFSRW
jgi:hypothetical protein